MNYLQRNVSSSARRTGFLLKYFAVIILVILLIILLSLPSQAQDDYKKDNKRFFRSYYRKQNNQYIHACALLEKKRHYAPKRIFISNHKRKPMAEVGASAVLAKAESAKPISTLKPSAVARPAAYPLPTNPKIEQISDKKLEALHQREDAVLLKNDLPLPTSQKQIEVRKIVSDKLASKTNVYPLNLAPLYFNFNEDEFSVVDMEPFLIAAEYALQGRTVLIEGHTDNRGADDFNVKLSIKRVQKIRQLMLDMGVPDDRISIVGYGEEVKSNDNKTAEGRQLNRRVDFTIF